MITHICHDHDFQKRLDTLKHSGGTASLAAQKAQILLTHIEQNGTIDGAGKLTKNGEARLKNSVKFDLGNGYRLICTKEKDKLYLRYIGSHDECDRWIKQHARDIKNVSTPCHCKTLTNTINILLSDYHQRVKDKTEDYQEDYDDQPEYLNADKINNRLLSRVFSGLTQKNHK